ncbi:MAG TPA: family 10 glycosylhydrolase [Egibacteraceae bacterium]|nr:family 10 glycosylhydrolase [Egibacteraceae bacterium]
MPYPGSWPFLVALAVALAVAVPVAAPAAGAGAGCLQAVSASAPIERLGGPDRYATAACASAVAFPDGAAHVLVARGDLAGGLSDALAGTVLAHAVGGPVLLTDPARLPAATRDELVRLAPGTVTILGGPAAVSPAVNAEVAGLGVSVRRVAGSSREATAAALSQEAGAAGTAFVVNGRRPADSLVAAAPAARGGAKLLLSGQHDLPAVTEQALAGVQRVVVVGGYGVVGEAVEAHLRRLVGPDGVRRVSGADRGGTAASVARAFPSAGRRLLVGQGDANLVDAVAAGWVAARSGGPVLYAGRDAPGAGTDRWLRLGGLRPEGAASEPATRLVGGVNVLSGALVTALEARYEEARRGGPRPELRGVWIHLFDPTLKSRSGVNAVLDAAVRANLNTVVVQVARRQDAYYRSSVLPRTPDPELPADFDLLAHVVPAAHDRGLAVHAWMSTLPAYHSVYDHLPLPPDHVWARHGPHTADPWTTRSHTGAPSTYLDPGVPAVQDHVAAALAEIAAGYDVDAVHIDYLRYDGEQWGYHPTAVHRYGVLTGQAGTPAPSDPVWGQWRRRQTRDLARRVFLEVAAVDPDVAVSIAASTMGAGPGSSGGYPNTRTFRDVFQDWPAWLADGTIDAAFPMNYFREHDTAQRTWFDDWVSFEAHVPRPGRVLAVGQASYLNSVEGSLAQLARARGSSDGVVLYSYQQTTASGHPGALLAALPHRLFVDPAPAPALARHSSPAGHLVVVAADGVQVRIAPEGGGPAPPAVLADGTGRAGFLHLAPGRWIVTAPGFAPATVTITTRQVATVTLRADPS